MKIRTGYPLFFLLILIVACQQKTPEQKYALPAEAITASDAANYIGEIKTVYGEVVGATYAWWFKGQPTYMNLDKSHPKQVFNVMIWGIDRQKFGRPPEDRFINKTICVTGLIEEENGIPQVVVSSPSQIQILKSPGREYMPDIARLSASTSPGW